MHSMTNSNVKSISYIMHYAISQWALTASTGENRCYTEGNSTQGEAKTANSFHLHIW